MSATTTFGPAPGAVARDRHVADVEQRVAQLMGVLNQATSQLVEVIAEALDTGAWEGWGIRSPQHWVTWRCGVSPSRARRLVAMARRLQRLPATAERFAAGALTEDQTAVVCHHTTPAHDSVIAELAPKLTVPQLQRTLPSLPRQEPEPDANSETGSDSGPDVAPETQADRREVTFGWRDDGRWWLRALLPPDEGAVVQAALEAARDAEFRTRHPDGFEDTLAGATARDRITWSDALVRLASAKARGPAVQVFVHVDADAAVAPRFHLGPVLPPAIVELLSCDASVRTVLRRTSRPVAFGRSARTAPPVLRTLIEHRDGGCRVPGCSQVRWLHIHHLVHWTRGGRTDPSNLAALCPVHHRMVHHGRLHIRGDPGDPDGLTFTDAEGRDLTPAQAIPPDRLPEAPPYANPTGERVQGWAVSWD